MADEKLDWESSKAKVRRVQKLEFAILRGSKCTAQRKTAAAAKNPSSNTVQRYMVTASQGPRGGLDGRKERMVRRLTRSA
jgi:hypothetical protein